MNRLRNHPRCHKDVFRVHYIDHHVAVTLCMLDLRAALDEAAKYLYDCKIVPRPQTRDEAAALLGRITVSRVRLEEPVIEGLSPEEVDTSAASGPSISLTDPAWRHPGAAPL